MIWSVPKHSPAINTDLPLWPTLLWYELSGKWIISVENDRKASFMLVRYFWTLDIVVGPFGPPKRDKPNNAHISKIIILEGDDHLTSIAAVVAHSETTFHEGLDVTDLVPSHNVNGRKYCHSFTVKLGTHVCKCQTPTGSTKNLLYEVLQKICNPHCRFDKTDGHTRLKS